MRAHESVVYLLHCGAINTMPRIAFTLYQVAYLPKRTSKILFLYVIALHFWERETANVNLALSVFVLLLLINEYVTSLII